MTKTVYYPRVKSINFYDPFGNITGGMSGKIAGQKFFRMVKIGKMPRISLRKKVQVTI